MEKKHFGTINDGAEVSLYSFTNKNGMTMTVTELGATLVSLLVPDRDGNPVDVVLGYDTPQEYIAGGCYFGAVIAPSGNRIDKGRFTIGDKTYQLPINDNENNLHSGSHGVDEWVWNVAKIDEETNSISFQVRIPDGNNGFPGNIDTTVTYTLTEDNAVVLHYEAVSDADTVANMTNHTYFNLAGHASGSIEDHTLILTADHYTPVIDSQAIPTGEIAPVAGTPMDFLTGKKIGLDVDADFEQLKYVGGFDHNFVLLKNTLHPRPQGSQDFGLPGSGHAGFPALKAIAGRLFMIHIAGSGDQNIGAFFLQLIQKTQGFLIQAFCVRILKSVLHIND